MSIDFFQRLATLKGTYIHPMSCPREDFAAKISLTKHFWKNLRGVSKKSFILKDPVDFLGFDQILAYFDGKLFEFANLANETNFDAFISVKKKVCTKILQFKKCCPEKNLTQKKVGDFEISFWFPST